MGDTYGYARVSATDQNAARQIAALCEAGVKSDNIYIDHKSGKDFNRPAWKRLKRKLHRDDLLIIQTIDRFGRSYDEVQEEWRSLVNRKGIDIRILDMPILDTTQNTCGLTGRLVFDMVLSLMSYAAETERRNIHERQRQGIALAKERGVRFGRPVIVLTEEQREYLAMAAAGRMKKATAARLCGVCEASIYRWIKMLKTNAASR